MIFQNWSLEAFAAQNHIVVLKLRPNRNMCIFVKLWIENTSHLI
jgi:hypothetical protein